MTDIEKKKQKAEYDREYRKRKRDEIRFKKKLYCESEAGRAMQKRQREKRKEYHNEYCRSPEQRKKEKHRRHIRENKLGLKKCLICCKEKNVLEFESFLVFEDGRSYLCKECEKAQKKQIGLTTKGTMTAIVVRSDYRLTRRDIAKHPYLIEANKYLISLKKLIQ